jgi:hypothetical protein
MAWAAMGRTARMNRRYLMVKTLVCSLNGSLKRYFEWEWQETGGVCYDASEVVGALVIFSGLARDSHDTYIYTYNLALHDQRGPEPRRPGNPGWHAGSAENMFSVHQDSGG